MKKKKECMQKVRYFNNSEAPFSQFLIYKYIKWVTLVV